MKNFNLLFLFAVLSLPSLFCQSFPQQSVSFGLSRNTLYLYAPGEYRVYGGNSSHRSVWDTSDATPVRGIGLSAGYDLQWSPRWEASLRASYSGNTEEELILRMSGYSSSAGSYDHTFQRSHKYRALWFEGLLFRRILGSYVTPDIQLGTGITYLLLSQDYLSGFDFDLDRGIYDVQYFSKRRKARLGLPLQIQVKYPISPDFKIGINAYANLLFDGSAVTGVTAFATYRLREKESGNSIFRRSGS